MALQKAQIPFHRRSRYEDMLELVNDNEEALKPFPNRDAVFYKASNKGSYFDGRDHLDKLRIEQKRINERRMRDHLLREYADDNDLTHRNLFTVHERPDRYNLDADNPETEVFGNGDDEFFDTDEDLRYTQGEVESLLQRASENMSQNQGAIVQAHQQQIEQEQEQGEGVLRRVARGTIGLGRDVAGGIASNVGTVGRNIAGNLESGSDLATSVVSGVAQPALEALGGAVMRRVLPQPRPLLDFDRQRQVGEFTSYPAYSTPQLHLEAHAPNVGPTQQPLPVSSRQQPLALEAPPTPNVQHGGASSSAAPPPQQQPPLQQQNKPKTRLTKKTNIKDSAETETEGGHETSYHTIIPSKIGIQSLRYAFEEANNKNKITTTSYRQYRSMYNKWISSSGDPDTKKMHLRDLQRLYRDTLWRKPK